MKDSFGVLTNNIGVAGGLLFILINLFGSLVDFFNSFSKSKELANALELDEKKKEKIIRLLEGNRPAELKV